MSNMKLFVKITCTLTVVSVVMLGCLVRIEVTRAYKSHGVSGWFLGNLEGEIFNTIDFNADGEPELIRVGEDNYKIRTGKGWIPVHIKDSRNTMLRLRLEPSSGGSYRAATVALRADDGRQYKWRDEFKAFRESNWIKWPLLPALGFRPEP